ncbi:MAG: hypothetical protein F6J97_21560 [Leptolyngbya sp. SIO4C1]|nr:hypothetical protein [Leptolyngbya sp. SIO4C1]
MRQVLDDLDPFCWLLAIAVSGATIVQAADIRIAFPHADFAQAMTAEVEPQ